MSVNPDSSAPAFISRLGEGIDELDVPLSWAEERQYALLARRNPDLVAISFERTAAEYTNKGKLINAAKTALHGLAKYTVGVGRHRYPLLPRKLL